MSQESPAPAKTPANPTPPQPAAPAAVPAAPAAEPGKAPATPPADPKKAVQRTVNIDQEPADGSENGARSPQLLYDIEWPCVAVLNGKMMLKQ